MLQSINPYTNEVLATFEAFSTSQIQACLQQAKAAFIHWKTVSLAVRSKKMTILANLLREKTEELAVLISKEMGKPIKEARAEIDKCAFCCDHYANFADEFLKPENCITNATKTYLVFEPLGCVLGIMPWNFPFWQVFRFAVPALLSGNVVLLKHATNTQLCSQSIEKLFVAAGFPLHCLQSLVIENEQVEQIIASPVVQALTLTGSERAGCQVAQLAGKYLKKTVLELGGSDAFIVLADANIDHAVTVAVQSRLLNSGQSCIAAKRFLVAKEVYEEFVNRLQAKIKTLTLGNPLDETTDIGVIARADLLQNLHQQVLTSIAKGAILVAGGKIDKGFYLPTILTNVCAGMPAFDEELFGGVFAISSFETEAEAIQLANASQYGLAASIWTRKTEKAELLARQLDCGAVFINALVRSDPRVPFGGVKNSGYGRELSYYGMKEFVNVKTVWVE